MKTYGLGAAVALFAAVGVSATCITCKSSDDAPPPPPAAAAAALAPGKTGAASVTGVVMYKGAPPPPFPTPGSSAFPECAKRMGAPVDTSAVVADGKVKNAFVYVKSGLAPGSYPVPSEDVELDQRQCEFEPRVLGVRVGQAVKLLNSDPVLHNVHARSGGTTVFNRSLPTAGSSSLEKFKEPQVMAPVGCDVHPWMRAYVGVMAHPFFAVSAADGSFVLKGLPAGTYTVAAWHERLGTAELTVTVADGEAKTLALELPGPK